jgi:hypothetical protein
MQKKICYIFASMLLISGCTKDFGTINQNPYFSTQTEIGPLFNTVVSSLRLGWNEQFYLHNENLYGLTQLGAKTGVGFDNPGIGTEEVWKNYYGALAHIRAIEERLDAAQVTDTLALNNVRAQVKILAAYKTFRITDLFGDIPFFDAGKGYQDLSQLRPKFDSQESIYKYLLNELKWAETHLNTSANPVTPNGEEYLSLGGFETLFGNDYLRWRKFANALRLRHAMRMVEKDPAFATPIIQEIIEGNLPIIAKNEDVVMMPGQQSWLNWIALNTFANHNKLRMGSTIWSQLSTTNALDGSGIFDPRATAFFDTNNANKWAPYPNQPDASTPAEAGIPYEKHRDFNYNIKGAECLFSPFNYYLLRDEETIPEIILTSAEVQDLKAEAYLRGLGVAQSTPTAEGEYTLGLVHSLSFWQNIVQNSAVWKNKPTPLTEGEIFNVTNHPRFSIFTTNDKLQFIYAQLWLDAFRQPWEAFALWRRTGMTPREGSAPAFYRFPYPPSEATSNSANYSAQLSLMGRDERDVKVWWME